MRIKAFDVKNNTARLKSQLNGLKEQIADSDILLHYKDALIENPSEQICKLEAVLRLQILLLICLRNQQLDIQSEEWRICISKSDTESLDSLLKTAYEDLKLWMQNISDMLKLKIHFPEIVFVRDSENADLCVDYSLFERYDETCVPVPNNFIIRTDYFSNNDHYEVAVSDTLKYTIELEEPSNDLKCMRFLLRNLFDFDDFQEGQIPVIANVLEGNDTVGIMPTGAGKSLCYQFSALLQPGVTLVIDPILSLMQDQKRSMRQKGITHNEMIASQMGGKERSLALDKLRTGHYQMVWISPE